MPVAAQQAVHDAGVLFFLQVESSSITTRNGAIQREMQDAYRKLICANVERKVRREQETNEEQGERKGRRRRKEGETATLKSRRTLSSYLLYT